MKYFIVSDIHSFYSPLKAALANVGYDKDNPEHTLIVCGDLFDRGEESRQLLFFIMFDIPRERRILIRGNHEYDFVKLVKGEYVADKWDRDSQIGCYRSNGTIRTMCSLARIPEEYTRHLYWLSQYKDNDKDDWENYDNARHQALQYFEDARNNEMVKIVAEWIQSDDWIDFYELDNLILTHSFIPTIPQYTYYSTWRECVKHGALWEEATWVCPYIAYAKGGFDPEFKNGKTLVCGHWHTSQMWAELSKKDCSLETNPIYWDPAQCPGIIGIDACTAFTHGVNILIYENNTLTGVSHNGQQFYIADFKNIYTN